MWYRGDGTLIRRVRERFLRSEARRNTFGALPLGPEEVVRHPEPDGPFGYRYRAWYASEHRWRQEVNLPGGGLDIWAATGMQTIGSRDHPPNSSIIWDHLTGERSRADVPPWLPTRFDTYWTFYPLRTDEGTGLVGTLEEAGNLRVEEGLSFAGRKAVRLVAVSTADWEYAPEPLWWGADEYEVVADAERGVLLRTASRLGGRDIDAREIEEVFFDEPFGEEVFRSREPLPWR
jgi:hypothetical protein